MAALYQKRPFSATIVKRTRLKLPLARKEKEFKLEVLSIEP